MLENVEDLEKTSQPKRLIRRGPPSQKTLFLLSLMGTTNLLLEKIISRYKIDKTIIQLTLIFWENQELQTYKKVIRHGLKKLNRNEKGRKQKEEGW